MTPGSTTQTGPAVQTGVNEPGVTVPGILWVHPREQFLAFGAGPVVIGRADDAGAMLTGEQVSRRHALIHRKASATVITDTGSRNGTFVNTARVEEVALGLGDVVRIGDWVGVVTELSSSDYANQCYVAEPEPGVVAGPRSRALWTAIDKLSRTQQSLLIEGPSGTGKEVVSRAIHRRSFRKGPFVGINCAALPEALVEAQLFGYARGAFTGATQSSSGLIASAEGGTLLLDEIADLPLGQQPKLLRAIEERSVLRVGESTPRPIDVRFLAASQTSLWSLAQDGKFRADLLGRLAGGSVRLLALRDRREEIPRIFGAQFAAAGGEREQLKATAIEALCAAEWPLNVRQLLQVARLTATLGQGLASIGAGTVREALRDVGGESAEHLRQGEPQAVPISASKGPVSGRRARWLSRHQTELTRLQHALEQCGGNVSEAARSIDLPRWRAVRLLRGWDEGQGLNDDDD